MIWREITKQAWHVFAVAAFFENLLERALC
jgi:hypothetical protein